MPEPADRPAHYDARARRETPLAQWLCAKISHTGPIKVSEFVDLCLQHPEFGYYRQQPAIGQSGDFVTAPEISQVFGELIGIWCAVVWQQMGEPHKLNLVELGPGRGTLMADALRAISKMPGLNNSIELHLVESNRALRDLQEQKLAPSVVRFRQHQTVDELCHATGTAGDDQAWIVIANEFLDALGGHQLIARDGAWYDRTVELDASGGMQFGIGAPFDAEGRGIPPPNCQPDGDIFEFNPAIHDVITPLLRTLAATGNLAALFIDYGHEQTAIGETLQALRDHNYEHPLTSPGEADLTFHVDFADCVRCFDEAGLTTHGPLPQAEFLGRLGIIERASRLMASNPARAGEIEAGTLRLMAPNGMGTRFKVLGASSPAMAPLPGLEPNGL